LNIFSHTYNENLSIMKIKDLAISESGFVFNPYTGESFSVNSIGYEILKLLRRDLSQDEILQEILNNYEISKEQAEKDVMDFLSMLEEYNLLEK
jgi:PqqD family protein of HPr-rel-A system